MTTSGNNDNSDKKNSGKRTDPAFQTSTRTNLHNVWWINSDV